jgi:signal transduction histidine kinase
VTEPDAISAPRAGEGRAAALAPRLTLVVVSVVFAGFVVNAFQYVVAQRATFTHIAPAALFLGVMLVLQVGFFSNPNADLRSRRAYGALLVQAVMALAPLALYGPAWTGLQGFLVGDALLVLRPLAGWLVFAVIALGNGFVQYRVSSEPLQAVYIVDLTAVIGLVVFGLSRLRSLVKELDETRSRLAGLAVARERLRFARDLHDLLGFSLSAITLKAELTHRVLTQLPDRARLELTEIIEVSRQALADVRSVAASYRELSLADSLASARSVLTAADVEVTVAGDPGPLPSDVHTVLATVLREGVTNLLRHSSATYCHITITRSGTQVSLELLNDGAPHAEPGAGQGTGNLRSRTEVLGRSLKAGREEPDRYRVRAELPLRADTRADQSDDGRLTWLWRSMRRVVARGGPLLATGVGNGRVQGARAEGADRGGLVPRVGLVVVAAVVAGYAGNAVVLAFAAGLAGWETTVAVACVVVSAGIVVGVFSRPVGLPARPVRYGLLAVMGVATFGPIVVFGDPFLGTPGLLAGCLVLARGWPWAVAVMVVMGAAHWVLGGDYIGVTYGVLLTINHGLVVFALARLRSMIQDLHDAREELAELALAQERERFADDLHELLGINLAAITLKSELSHRLVDRDPGRAGDEVLEIIGISRRALADVRAVAAGYREL